MINVLRNVWYGYKSALGYSALGYIALGYSALGYIKYSFEFF